jgi:hypothetical protein
VVGIDCSFWGLAALSWAAEQARLAGADLDLRAAADAVPDRVLDHRIDEIRHAMSTRTVPVSLSADPASALIGESQRASLVVLGCRGNNHRGLGIDAAVPIVVRGAACDVVVVGGRMDAVRGAHRQISALINGSGIADIVRAAVRVAAQRDSGLRIVCHVSPVGRGPARHSVGRLGSFRDAIDLAHRLAPRIPIEIEVIQGGPHEVVAGLTGTDLLVIGVGQQLDRLVWDALYHARSPVLLTRSRTVATDSRRW